MSLAWRSQTLSSLTATDMYKILQLRANVFIVEQNGVVLDPDGLDLLESCHHVMGTNADGAIMAYARVLGPGTKGPAQTVPVIGRVVVAKAARGTGLGRQVMHEAVAAAQRAYPGQGCQLGAQAYLETFYNSLGFARLPGSAPYDDHGIPHIDMKRE